MRAWRPSRCAFFPSLQRSDEVGAGRQSECESLYCERKGDGLCWID
jgi:hypothetical protein